MTSENDHSAVSRTPRTAVVVTGPAQPGRSLDFLSANTSGYDVVFIEPIAQ